MINFTKHHLFSREVLWGLFNNVLQTVGDRQGLHRMGHFVAFFDEAWVQVALDFFVIPPRL
ncbi:MAG: hypothetical protein HC799_08165 [Limnothrix sp. RL_2_0]|nr:hypothetical protein [Limnothrix sp. RL_2_0]